MAIKATFDADFSKFSDAAANAKAALGGFEGQANKVQTAMNRIADSFSGRQIIQQATLTANAIDKIGVATLTAANKARAFQDISAGIEQLKLRGEDIPPVMQKIADATKQIPKNMQATSDAARALQSTLAGVFSIQSLISFGQELLQMADDISRVSDQTGLLTDEVQKLNYIGSQTGVTLEQMTGAVGQLQNRLASGDDSAIGAMKRLGLSFDDLKNKDPYEQLLAISDGFAKIKNPAAQTQIAMDLFGKAGIPMLAAMKANMRAMGEEAPVMSEATVRALDQAGDSFAKFQLQIKVWAAEAYNTLSGAFDRWIASLSRNIATAIDELAMVLRALEKIPGAAKLFPGLDSAIKSVSESAQWFRDVATGLEHPINQTAKAARGVVPPLEQYGKAQNAAADAAKKHAEALQQLFNQLSGADVAGKIRDLDAVTRRLADAGLLTGHALKEVVDQARQLAASSGTLTPRPQSLVDEANQFQHVLDLVTLSQQHNAAAAKFEDQAWSAWQSTVSNTLATLRTAPPLLQSVNLSGIVPQIDTSKIPTAKIPTPTGPSFLSRAFGDPAQFAQQIPQTMISAFQGGGGAGKSVGGLIGTSLGSEAGGVMGKAIGGTLGKTIGGIMGPLGTLAGSILGDLAGKAFGHFFGTAGRDAVKDFAASFGGFDALHAKLNALGAEGERLWIQLTQGTGRNNPEQARANIDAINQALSTLDQKHQDAAAAAQKDADAQPAAFEKTRDAAQQAIDGLNSQIQELQNTIANEAPEEEMGVIEQQTRAKIEALEKEKTARQTALDDWSAAAEQAAKDAADAVDLALQGKEYHITVIPDLRGFPPVPAIPMAAGGDFMVPKPTLFLAGEAGPERATFTKPGLRAASTPLIVQLHLDSRVAAEAILPNIPGVVKRYGLG